MNSLGNSLYTEYESFWIDHVVMSLTNKIERKKINHPYQFIGPFQRTIMEEIWVSNPRYSFAVILLYKKNMFLYKFAVKFP